jgi:hypothetical protein
LNGLLYPLVRRSLSGIAAAHSRANAALKLRLTVLAEGEKQTPTPPGVDKARVKLVSFVLSRTRTGTWQVTNVRCVLAAKGPATLKGRCTDPQLAVYPRCTAVWPQCSQTTILVATSILVATRVYSTTTEFSWVTSEVNLGSFCDEVWLDQRRVITDWILLSTAKL